MEFTTFGYEELMEELNATGELEPTNEICKVAVCKKGFIDFMRTDGTLKLLEVIEDVDIHYKDGAMFFMVDKENKACLISEAIAFETYEEFLEEMSESYDVEVELIDEQIHNLKGKVDYFVTSNENVL